MKVEETTTEEWIHGDNLNKDQAVWICNDKIHILFKDCPTIETMLREDVYEASSLYKLRDLNRELNLLHGIFDKLKGV